MAQIIKHRRGNLEGLKDATTRAGELLVVTGSAGLGTIANGADLVFVGIDGSTASPVNKILQGTTVPNLTGASYNTHVDGIPFYDTDDNKLYILNKGGNIEVKATPETGGTGIISGSAQLANSTVSNESLNSATGSYLTTVDISSNTNLAVSDTTEVNMILTGDTISAELIGGVVSGSAQITGITNTQLAGSIANGKLSNSAITISGTSVSLGGAITDEVLFGGTGVISGSAQLLNVATDFGSGRLSGASIGDLAGTSTITGSFVGNGAGLTGLATSLTVDGDSGTSDVDLIADDLQFLGTSNEIVTAVTKVGTDVKVTMSLPDDVTIGNDLTVAGDLTVQGTTTTVDSATLDISGSLVRINYGGGAVEGGLEVTDKTASSLSTGSLLWDGTNDYWKGGAKGGEVQLATVSGTQTLTNKTINGSQLVNSSVANGKLANSAVTISGTSVSLGGAITDETLFGGVGVVTGSAQIVSGLVNQATDFGSGRVSGDNFGDAAGTSTFTGSFVGNGANLTGLATNLTIGADNGSDDTVALTTGTLNFVGTSNEIETTVSNDQIQIGIPTNPTLSGNVTVTGNLTVEGTTTTIDSTTVNIGDRILELNYARGAGDAGLLVSDVDGATTVSGSLLWDASSDHWMAGGLGSEKEIARLNASPTSNTVLKANASGLLVDSLITDDGTNVTISGTAELRVNGATASGFAFFNADKSIESVAASTDGDVIQWNGSSFVASNSIDGGTF